MAADIREIPGLRIEQLPAARLAYGFLNLNIETRRIVNIVFHGHTKPFRYEHYGIHLGTEDRLIFIGPPDTVINGEFIDCRVHSPTWGRHVTKEFRPSIRDCLIIPPGIAHIFDGLENIYTINLFRNFLPEPDGWLNGSVVWSIATDTINVPRGIRPSAVPRLECNHLEASDTFYKITSDSIVEKLDGKLHEYPLVERVEFQDNTSHMLRISRTAPRESDIPEFEPVPGIAGCAWKRRVVVTGGEDSDAGYTVFPAPNLLEIFDASKINGITFERDTCAEGIASFTFLGHPEIKIDLEISKNDGALHNIHFSPSPLRELILPKNAHIKASNIAGVLIIISHGFDDIE
jgi:hypothetical protein